MSDITGRSLPFKLKMQMRQIALPRFAALNRQRNKKSQFIQLQIKNRMLNDLRLKLKAREAELADANKTLDANAVLIKEQLAELAAARDKWSVEVTIHAHKLDEWHEAIGDVLWWKFPIDEPPYCGSPLADDWPGYHTHFTKLAIPAQPCDHSRWLFGMHGRFCPCGTQMVDFGD